MTEEIKEEKEQQYLASIGVQMQYYIRVSAKNEEEASTIAQIEAERVMLSVNPKGVSLFTPLRSMPFIDEKVTNVNATVGFVSPWMASGVGAGPASQRRTTK